MFLAHSKSCYRALFPRAGSTETDGKQAVRELYTDYLNISSPGKASSYVGCPRGFFCTLTFGPRCTISSSILILKDIDKPDRWMEEDGDSEGTDEIASHQRSCRSSEKPAVQTIAQPATKGSTRFAPTVTRTPSAISSHKTVPVESEASGPVSLKDSDYMPKPHSLPNIPFGGQGADTHSSSLRWPSAVQSLGNAIARSVSGATSDTSTMAPRTVRGTDTVASTSIYGGDGVRWSRPPPVPSSGTHETDHISDYIDMVNIDSVASSKRSDQRSRASTRTGYQRSQSSAANIVPFKIQMPVRAVQAHPEERFTDYSSSAGRSEPSERGGRMRDSAVMRTTGARWMSPW